LSKAPRVSTSAASAKLPLLGQGRELTPEEIDEFKHRTEALASRIRGELQAPLRQYWKERRRPFDTRPQGG